MGIAFLLLGLLPLAFMPDIFGGVSDEDDAVVNDRDAPDDNGDLLGIDGATQNGGGPGSSAGIDLIADMPGFLGDAGFGAGAGAGDLAFAPDAPADPAGAGPAEDMDNSTPDGPDQGSPDDADILQPVNQVDLPDPGTSDADPGSVLQPVNPIDVASGQDVPAETVLAPVDQIDTGTAWVDVGGAVGDDLAEIDDFQIGRDVLHISVNPDLVKGPVDVNVSTSADGQDSDVFIEKQLIAVLRGVPDATQSDVRVDIEPGKMTKTVLDLLAMCAGAGWRYPHAAPGRVAATATWAFG